MPDARFWNATGAYGVPMNLTWMSGTMYAVSYWPVTPKAADSIPVLPVSKISKLTLVGNPHLDILAESRPGCEGTLNMRNNVKGIERVPVHDLYQDRVLEI